MSPGAPAVRVRYSSRDGAALTAALVAPLAAAGILLPFRAAWPDTNVALLLVVAVVAVAAIGSRLAAARARRLKVIAITDAGYLAQIHHAGALAQSARSADAVVDHVREQLIGLLDLEACRFDNDALLGHPPRLEANGTVIMGHTRWDVEESGLPGDEVEVRTFGPSRYYGRFMMNPAPRAGRSGRPGPRRRQDRRVRAPVNPDGRRTGDRRGARHTEVSIDPAAAAVGDTVQRARPRRKG